MKKILVLRGGALGDFIVTLPALALLREKWPAARIEFAGNSTAASLAIDAGLLDSVHSQHEARWRALFMPPPLPEDFAAWLAHLDLVVNFWPDPDGTLRAHFPARDGQRFITAAAHPVRAPASAHYCEALHPLGITARENVYALRPPAGGARGVAVHPGSGSPRKNWPLERWLGLLPTLPPPVHVILGEAEIERWGALTSSSLTRGVREQLMAGTEVHLAVDLPLRELADVLARCALFVGHDSGVSHLATACGVPSVLLFGPTDPAMWAPPSPLVSVLQHGPDLTAISVDDVQRAVVTALSTR